MVTTIVLWPEYSAVLFTAKPGTHTVYHALYTGTTVLIRQEYMVLCTASVEDNPGINSCRNLRESFCACCDVVPEQCRTKSSQPCDMTLFAQQNRVFFHHFSFSSHHHQSLFRRWVHSWWFCCLWWWGSVFFLDSCHGGHGVLVFSFGAVHRVLYLRVALVSRLHRYGTVLVRTT